MPNHVHILIWPLDNSYDIGKIESGIKGIMAKRYRKYLLVNRYDIYESFLIKSRNEKEFIFWQKGGGFDRNLWNTKAIHDSINYIETNPVRSLFVTSPDEWQWSSAFARVHKVGVIPDVFSMPVSMPNPQYQRFGII
jgi:putative transposase